MNMEGRYLQLARDGVSRQLGRRGDGRILGRALRIHPLDLASEGDHDSVVGGRCWKGKKSLLTVMLVLVACACDHRAMILI